MTAWSLSTILVLALAGALWIVMRGSAAAQHLQAAQAQIDVLTQSFDDPDGAAVSIRNIREDARAARALTNDPVWAVGSLVPWIGPQIDAVSTLARTLDEVSSTALAPLADLLATVDADSFRFEDGALDLSPFREIRDAAEVASSTLDAASDTLGSIDIVPLLRPLREIVQSADEKVTQAANAAATLHRATELAPTMLGGDQPRTWLLLFQNPAELRSLGGMPGATAVVTADQGRIELIAQGDASIPRFPAPVIPLDPDERALYGDRPGLWFSGTTVLPDFSSAAPLAREMWQLAHDVSADGVLSLDPIALSYLLEATGPITLPNGAILTADNAVEVLLNGVYLNYSDATAQNEFFAQAAASVFGALTNGAADPSAVITALSRASDERRLLLWSSLEDEQSILDETTLAGHLPRSDDRTAQFGVYLNDGSGSKLGYYLRVEPDLRWDRCPTDEDSGQATLQFKLQNTAPLDAATSLPPSIAGGYYGVPAGTLRVVTYIYLPVGSGLLDATLTPDVEFGSGRDGDYRVLTFAVDLAPGDAATASVTVALTGAALTDVRAQLTPAFGATSLLAECASR